MNAAFIKRIISVIFFAVLATSRLSAQDFELSPAKLLYTAEPGENQSKTISVKNHGSKKQSFLIALNDYVPSESGGKNILPPNTTKRSCTNWLNINPSFFDLNPGEEKKITVTLMVPSSEYLSAWCMLYVQPVQEQTASSASKEVSAGMRLAGRIGITVNQTPKSNLNQQVKIYNLKEIPAQKQETLSFAAAIDNMGECITACKTFILITNLETLEENKYSEMEIETFPKNTREILYTIPKILPKGIYSIAAIVDYGSKSSLEGAEIRYEVK